jgi:hypothetical protein
MAVAGRGQLVVPGIPASLAAPLLTAVHMLIGGHVQSRSPASGTVALAATLAGHDICPSTAATFPAEVAMAFVSAISPRADGAASQPRRRRQVGAPTALSL